MSWPAVAVVVSVLILQTLWIHRSLGRAEAEIKTTRDELGQRLDRVDDRLDAIHDTILHEHGERIARLEARG